MHDNENKCQILVEVKVVQDRADAGNYKILDSTKGITRETCSRASIFLCKLSKVISKTSVEFVNNPRICQILNPALANTVGLL